MINDFNFLELDTNKIKKELKTAYEEIMNTKIASGDPAEDFINWITYVVMNLNNNINFTAKMNLLKYSKGKYLDALGEFTSTYRILEREAECMVEYTFSQSFNEIKIIPKGHKIAKEDFIFESTENIILKTGEIKTTGRVKSLMTGTIVNGIEVGEINTIVDDIPYLLSVKNITKTSGGANIETDDSYRERIRLKPFSFSVAGPKGAYKYYTLTAHQDIKDAHIFTPESTPGVVKIVPLMNEGVELTDEIINSIKTTLSDDNVRPFTDKVEVTKPKEHNYDINFKYWITKTINPSIVENNVKKAVNDYILWQREKLGRDINPNKLIQLLMLAGAKRVEITSPIYTKLESDTIAKDRSTNILPQGEEDE